MDIMMYGLFWCFIGNGGINDGSYCKMQGGPFASKAECVKVQQHYGFTGESYKCMGRKVQTWTE